MNKVGDQFRLSPSVVRISQKTAFNLVDANSAEINDMMTRAAEVRDAGHGAYVTYSRNVFVPLTHLCRDVCHYCTFAQTPKPGRTPFLSVAEVLSRVSAAARAGCTEVLFTLGDKPERRYPSVRSALQELGHNTTISYLADVADRVQRETGLLVHVNPGVMSAEELALLRTVSVSQGLMLESATDRLCDQGGPHYGSPDKVPSRRLETIRQAGVLRIPFTTGLLVGIGETRSERIDALLKVRDLHDAHGHIQELIIQNFKPKPDTRMADASAAPLDELLWTIAMARLLFGPKMNIQAPPNLTSEDHSWLIKAGINDWGGVSPVTPDFVNPEAPWPEIDALRTISARAGKVLVERLATYPDFVRDADIWIEPELQGSVLALQDSEGFAREGTWFAGGEIPIARRNAPMNSLDADCKTLRILARAQDGDELSVENVCHLLSARGPIADRVCEVANELRQAVVGDTVSYVVNRNINYTNICTYHCAFCAFSKGRARDALRDAPYLRSTEEVVRMAKEAVARNATEVCLQGGIHPSFSGETYLEFAKAIHRVRPGVHIHGFSPLEVWHGATSMDMSISAYLSQLKDVGLRSLPGTAAEILDDEVRAIICPDKLSTDLWLDIMETAHCLGLPTTSTIMFGHVEASHHIARHLLRLRRLQERTGGFTEFVPLPFVHMEAPIFLKSRARRGPTLREAVLIHAVSRLVLHPHITNIQTSWVKMGIEGAKMCLNAGANDLGGTLMNESISRAAGATHGQELGPEEIRKLISSIGRAPQQRTTGYLACPGEAENMGAVG